MTLGRFFRTVRHLTPEQLFFGIVRRARHAHWRRRPGTARARMAHAAAQLPSIAPQQLRLRPIAKQVAQLQQAVHPQPVSALRTGRLNFLGREIELNSASHWQSDVNAGDSPLHRLTLAYFGWAVPLLTEGKPEDLRFVLGAVERLDAVPWSTPGIFRDLWNPYTVSHRLINLLTGLHLYGLSGGPAGPMVDSLLEHIRSCAAFVAGDLERDIQANHLLKNWTALAVYAAATATPGNVFAGLREGIRRSIAQLVLPDGGHAERSPMYQALGLMDVEAIRDSEAVPTLLNELDGAADRLRRALSVLTHPDGDIALFNDAWLGGAPPARTLQATPATPGCHLLPETGYAKLDAGGDVAIFDAGPCALDCQPGHAHADFLSFEMSVAHSRFIVDPGTGTYTAGVLRDQIRSAATHNGPHVVGHEPLEIWKSFRVGQRARAGFLKEAGLANVAPLWCAGWQDGYRRVGVEARRWLGLWPGKALLVLDIWIGLGQHAGRSRFLIPEPWKATARDGAVTFVGPCTVEIKPLLGEIGLLRQTGWWPRYGVEERASTIDLEPSKDGPVAAAALLITWGARTEDISKATLEQMTRALMTAPALPA